MGAEEIIVYAGVFLGLFFIGGLLGIASLPAFRNSIHMIQTG